MRNESLGYKKWKLLIWEVSVVWRADGEINKSINGRSGLSVKEGMSCEVLENVKYSIVRSFGHQERMWEWDDKKNL